MQHKQTPNQAWEIVGGGNAVLRLGHRQVPLAEISGISLQATEERDFLGSLLNFTAYLTVSGAFMILVLQAGWRERFLLAMLFFSIVGFTSLFDIAQSSRLRLYRMSIRCNDGSTVDFTSADAAEVDQLATALRAAGKA